MEPSIPYRPRVSRETRLLLTAGLLALAALWLQYVRKRDPGDRQVGGGRLGLAGLAGVGAGGGDGSHVIGRDRSILKCRCDHDGEELCST